MQSAYNIIIIYKIIILFFVPFVCLKKMKFCSFLLCKFVMNLFGTSGEDRSARCEVKYILYPFLKKTC